MSTHFPSTVRQLRQETLSIHLPRWSSRYQTLVRRLPSYWELCAVAEANNLSLANADSALLTRLEQLEGIVSRHGLEPIIAEAASTKETRRSQTPARMQLHSQQATGNRNGSPQRRAQNSPPMASPSSVTAQPPTSRPQGASSSLQQPDDDDFLRGSSLSEHFQYDMLRSPRYEHQLQSQHAEQHPTQTRFPSALQFNTVSSGNPDISHRIETVHEINNISPCDRPIRFDFPTHSTSSASPGPAGRYSDSNGESSRQLHHLGPHVVAENVDVEEEQSYGTLVMGQGGRSKYLGPTAGSEWLRDVSLCHSNSNMYSAYLDSKSHETTPSLEISLDYHLLRSPRHRCPHIIHGRQLFLIHFLFTLQRPKSSHGLDTIFFPDYQIEAMPTCLLIVTTVPSAGSEYIYYHDKSFRCSRKS